MDFMKFIRSTKGIIIIVISLVVISLSIGLIVLFSSSRSSEEDKPSTNQTITLKNALFASTNDHRIVSIDWPNKQYTTVVEENIDITCFDYSIKHDTLFYATNEPGEPVKTWNTNKYQNLLNNTRPWTKTSIAVDDVNDKLYLMNGASGQLWVLDLKSDYYYDTGIYYERGRPTEIAIDPLRRLLFVLQTPWIDITVSDVVGGDSYPLGMETPRVINAFTIDHSRQLLYVAYDQHVISFDSERNGSYVVKTTGGLIESFALRMNELLHVTFSKSNEHERGLSVCDLNKTSQKCINDVTINGSKNITSKLLQIKSYRSIEHQITNPCDNNNGGCQHLCIFYQAPDSYKCACNSGWLSDDNEKTCYRLRAN